MKEYDIKITEVLEKTVQVQAESREEAEAIASENWNNSMYDMDSAEDYADVSFQAGEERDISPPELMDVLLVKPGEYPKPVQIGTELKDLQEAVGGYIQCVYPYEEPVGIICNEEGKLNGAVLNRALYGEDPQTGNDRSYQQAEFRKRMQTSTRRRNHDPSREGAVWKVEDDTVCSRD